MPRCPPMGYEQWRVPHVGLEAWGVSGAQGSLEEIGVLAIWRQDEGRGLTTLWVLMLRIYILHYVWDNTTLPTHHCACVVVCHSPYLPCHPHTNRLPTHLMSPPCTLAAHAPTSCPHTQCHSHEHQPPTHLPAAHAPDATRAYTGWPCTPAAHAPNGRPRTHLLYLSSYLQM